MIKESHIEININNKNIKFFKNKSYNCVSGEKILVKTIDLAVNSHVKITADMCGKNNLLSFQKYNKNIRKFNIYTCHTCSNIKNKKTNLLKYGFEYPLQNKEILEKIKQTNIVKYGCENVFQNDEIKEKIKKTNNDKLGVNYPQQNKEVMEKSKRSCFRKYGFNRASKHIDIINKTKDTKLEKYNNSGYVNVKKRLKTIIEKYGVINVSQISGHKEKCRNYSANKILSKYSFIKNVDYINYIYTGYCEKGHEYKTNIGLFHNRLSHKINTCTICYPEFSLSSDKENDLMNFIKENYIDKIIKNDRKILNGQELDIYLPEINVAFEYNGLYWHSNIYKDNQYHINKVSRCLENNIHLFNIWEDDWVYNNDEIKNLILKILLGKCKFDRLEQDIYGIKGNKRTEYNKEQNIYFCDGGKIILKND